MLLDIFRLTIRPDIVKAHLRRHGDPCSPDDDLPEVTLMEFCMEVVTPEKAQGWYAHSGYILH